MADLTTDTDWHQSARTRVRSLFEAGDVLSLWDILRPRDNVVSRKAIRDLDPTAPTARAPATQWHDWLVSRFPNLLSELESRSTEREAAAKRREEGWKRDQTLRIATSGPRWHSTGNVFANALDFVKALREKGYKAESTGIGTVRFVNPNGIFVGPLRNKHINAAIALTAAATPSTSECL